MKLFFFLLAPFVLLSSCNFLGGQRISGNGHVTTQDKQVGRFSRVNVSGGVIVHVRQGDNSAVRLETDENLLPYIEVYTQGSGVVIRPKRGYNLDPSHEMIAYITTPAFEEISVSGSCDIIGDAPLSGNTPLLMHVSGSGDIRMEVDLPSVSTGISGAGNVNLKGRATSFSADISGSGKVKCMDLMTDSSKLDLSGSADAEVTVSKQLDVDVSGSGDVRYRGNASVNQHISGAGSVKKVD